MADILTASPLDLHDATAPAPDIYEPLRQGQIRLLELISEFGEIVSFKTHTYDHSSVPAYYAVSYVCGDRGSCYKILVDGQFFAAKQNLCDALRRLLDHFILLRIARPLLWVDAISINQDDLEEKAEQVREMHRVFSGAKEVLVWLGRVPSNIRMVLHVFGWAAKYDGLWDQLPRGSAMSDLDDIRKVHDSLWNFGPAKLESRHQALVHNLACYSRWLEENYAVNYTQILALAVLLQEFYKVDSRQGGLGFGTALKKFMDMTPELWQALPRLGDAFWSALAALSVSEWFTRVWTFQEIRFASEATLLADDLELKLVSGPMEYSSSPLGVCSWESPNAALFETRHGGAY